MSDNQRINYIPELQIINTTLQEVKSNLSSNQNELFYILQFQLVFINQITQIYQALQDKETSKNEIISNLTKVNKENTEKMIEDFLQKINNPTSSRDIIPNPTKVHTNGRNDKSNIYSYYQHGNQNISKATIYSNNLMNTFTYINNNANGNTYRNSTTKVIERKRKESAPKINNYSLKKTPFSNNSSLANSAINSNVNSNKKMLPNTNVGQAKNKNYSQKEKQQDKEQQKESTEKLKPKKEKLDIDMTLSTTITNKDIIQRIKNKAETQRKVIHTHANSLTFSHSQASINKDIIISSIKLPKPSNDDFIDNNTDKTLNKSSSAIIIKKTDQDEDLLQSDNDKCDQSNNQCLISSTIKNPNPLFASTLLGESHYSINPDDLI